MKAQQTYRDANSGLPPKIPNDIFKPSNPGADTKDELSIFSGRTHTLTAKPTSTAVAGNTPPSTTKSRSSSDSPQLMVTNNSLFEGVHPSLVSDFNELIKSQLGSAYKADGEVFGREPIAVDGGSSDSGRLHQPTQMHMVRQHQWHQQQQQQQQPQQPMYQPDYQSQHFDKQEAERLKQEREGGSENFEMERQTMERQELARQQQQLHQQRELQLQQQQQQQRLENFRQEQE